MILLCNMKEQECKTVVLFCLFNIFFKFMGLTFWAVSFC